jgi:hypothetical protein
LFQGVPRQGAEIPVAGPVTLNNLIRVVPA